MIYHDLDFSQPTPMGFARCRRCGGFYTQEQFLAWRCEGAEVVSSRPAARMAGGLRCVLCGAAVMVDPTHRQFVAVFGATCTECFDKEPAHG